VSNAAQSPLVHRKLVVDFEARRIPSLASFRIIFVALDRLSRRRRTVIVGDPHQRIYGKPVGLSRCGCRDPWRSRKAAHQLPHHRETRAWRHGRAPGSTFEISDAGSAASALADRCFTANTRSFAGLS